MSTAPSIALEKTPDGVRLTLSGGWIIEAGAKLEREADAMLGAADGEAREALIDLSELEQLDTAGAWVIDRSRQALEAHGLAAEIVGARPEHTLLLNEAHFRPTD